MNPLQVMTALIRSPVEEDADLRPLSSDWLSTVECD